MTPLRALLFSRELVENQRTTLQFSYDIGKGYERHNSLVIHVASFLYYAQLRAQGLL
jgi:hypothetical protein